jgi:hypothetical protein
VAILSVLDITGRKGKDDDGMKREHTRLLRARCDRMDHTPADILADDRVPRKFQLCPWDLSALCASREAVQDAEDPFVWLCTLEYRSRLRGKTDPAQRQENPLDRPAEVDVDWEQFQRTTAEDIDGKTILNSAGDPPVDGVQVDDNRPLLTITRNQASFDLSLAIIYYDAVNTDPFLIFQPDTLKIRLKARHQFENEVFFWRVTASLHCRRERYEADAAGHQVQVGGWKFRLLDQGYRAFDLAEAGLPDRKARTILDKSTGQPVSHPALLDGKGNELALVAELGGNAGVKPVYIDKYEIYKRLPFANLISCEESQWPCPRRSPVTSASAARCTPRAACPAPATRSTSRCTSRNTARRPRRNGGRSTSPAARGKSSTSRPATPSRSSAIRR